ncbi:MAG: serine hydrolase [Spirulinaceae cyanobacterium SM2_1_0]|nr:serine hydrolase [Spirulinaceae cyanobacterium SM2_1_0]
MPSLTPLPPSPAELRQRQQAKLHLLPKVPVRAVAPPTTPAPTFLSVFALYTTRLLIASIGLGAIAGTLIATLDSTRRYSRERPTSEPQIAAVSSQKYPPALPLSQEIAPLKSELTALFEQYPQFQPGVFLIDLDTGAYLDWQAAKPFPAASTIKAPILVAFFQAVDAGDIRLDELLTMTPALIAGEAGDMQYQAPGTQFTALETAIKMIAISDNTATNMLIERLGGAEQLNQTFANWGLKATRLENWLPDLEGQNATSPLDLANLMAMVNRGDLVSLPSRDRLLDIMRQVEHTDLLPLGLEEGASIAHKTGRISSVLADAGLIDTPTGQRYIAVVMVQRPDNDEQAAALIQAVSRLAYEHFNQPRPPAPTATTESLDAQDSVATKDEEQ